MKQIKTKGVIIAEKFVSDFDKIVTILTPNLGKIECMAKGSRKTKSLLLAGTQFLCFGEYLLYKSSNNYIINSCETIEVFYDVRTDLDKLKYVAHITKIISDVTTENQNNYKTMQLYLNTIYTISNTDKPLELINSIFKLRLLSIIGYRPEIEKCKSCKTLENLLYFSFKDNGLKCKACGNLDKGGIEILETTKDAIRYIILADAKKIYSFNIPKESIKELRNNIENIFRRKIRKRI